MSSPTVTIFDPQGVARDIPYDMLHQAVAAKGVPAVRMQAPDGSIRLIPADKMQQAAQSGGKVLPLQQQEVQHPGFWSALGSDLKGMLSLPSGVSPYPGMDVEAKQAALAQGQQQNQSRQAAGYSAPYRALAPFAQGVGVNVPGMEQSAAQGDAAGVMGHAAAVPAAIAAGEVAGRVVPKVAPPVVRGAAKATNAVLAKAPGIVGAGAGAAIGGTLAGTVGAEVGGAAGAVLGRDLFKGVQVPGENFGIKSPTIGEGPVEYMGAADALKMKREDPQAFFLRQQQIAKYGMQDRPRGGMKMTGQVREINPTQPAATPEATPEATPAPNDQITASARVLQTKAQPKPPTDPAVLAKQAEALRGTTNDTVSQALPDASKGQQMRTQAEVDFYLRKGNVDAAQAALDKATGKKSDFPPPAPTNPGSTNDIRANLPETQARRFADTRNDAAVSQEMNWDLQRHGFMAESEARKEFIARNSTGTTKGDLVRAAGGTVPEQPVKYTKNKIPKSPTPSEDLTDILQQSLDAAKKRKQAGK